MVAILDLSLFDPTTKNDMEECIDIMIHKLKKEAYEKIRRAIYDRDLQDRLLKMCCYMQVNSLPDGVEICDDLGLTEEQVWAVAGERKMFEDAVIEQWEQERQDQLEEDRFN